jgi:hypothetical protein
MRRVNWVRVTIGGLVVGVVIRVFRTVLNGVVLAKYMDAVGALGRHMGGTQVAMFVLSLNGHPQSLFIWSTEEQTTTIR